MASSVDTNLTDFKINSVASEEVLKQMEQAGLLEPNQIYMTPDENNENYYTAGDGISIENGVISSNIPFIHVNKQITGLTNSSDTATKTKIDLTDVLPNDGKNYTLLISFNGWGEGAVGKTPQAYAYSTIITEGIRLAGGRNHVSNNPDQIIGSSIIPIASDRNLELEVLRVSSSRFIIHGYWRF